MLMSDIYRFRCIASSGAGYQAIISYKNPNCKNWSKTDRVSGPVSVGISRDVFLKDIKEIKDGASVRIVMAYGVTRTEAKETFTYKSNSANYAVYDGHTPNSKTLKCLNVICESKEEGEVSGFNFTAKAAYAFNVNIEYQNPGNKAKIISEVVRVNSGTPETIHIGEFSEISDGAKVRFIMDIVAGRKGVRANQVFTFKRDITCLAKYECTGTTYDETIKYLGKTDFKPAIFTGGKGRNSSICSSGNKGLTSNTFVKIGNDKLSNLIQFGDDGHVASIAMDKAGKTITTFASGPKGAKLRGHLWFMDEQYNCYEEDIAYHGKRPTENTTKIQNSNIKYISWNDKLLGGDYNPALRLITIKGKFEKTFNRFGFVRTEKDGRFFYNTKIDCPQKDFGYFDLYDYCFDYATNMEKKKFEFTSNGKEYIFWLWKGNYLNLGAGAELGFYEFERNISRREAEKSIRLFVTNIILALFASLIPEPITCATLTATINSILSEVFSMHHQESYKFYKVVDESQYLKMAVNLRGKNNLPANISSYSPKDNQWWITTFVPYLQGVQPKDLAPTYTITFTKDKEQLFNDFVDTQIKACKNKVEIIERDKIVIKGIANGWTFDRRKLTLEYTF